MMLLPSLILISGLAFHGITIDTMERSSATEEIRRNFLEHTVMKLLKRDWGANFRGSFKFICRQ